MNYGYARVSTKGQARDGNSLEDQEKLLRQNGATLIYREVYTGAEGTRPELAKLLSVIQRGDTFVVAKMDRFARSTDDALAMIKEFQKNGIRLHILNMGVVDDTPMGKLMVTMLAAFAEYERAMIVERMQAGKAIAKENPDYREGRKPANLLVGDSDFADAIAEVQRGALTKTDAAARLGIGRSTFYRMWAERVAT